MADTRRRALVAALIGALGVAVFVAGAGHVYLRQWRRAAAWFSLTLGVLLVLVSVTGTQPQSMGSPADLQPLVVGPFFALGGLSVLDAYRLGLRETASQADGDGFACPHCGRETDPDIDFCQWCTEPLAEAGTEPAAGQVAGSERSSRSRP
jgi:hypothetical protein